MNKKEINKEIKCINSKIKDYRERLQVLNNMLPGDKPLSLTDRYEYIKRYDAGDNNDRDWFFAGAGQQNRLISYGE